jgi:hypothetical protein
MSYGVTLIRLDLLVRFDHQSDHAMENNNLLASGAPNSAPVHVALIADSSFARKHARDLILLHLNFEDVQSRSSAVLAPISLARLARTAAHAVSIKYAPV